MRIQWIYIRTWLWKHTLHTDKQLTSSCELTLISHKPQWQQSVLIFQIQTTHWLCIHLPQVCSFVYQIIESILYILNTDEHLILHVLCSLFFKPCCLLHLYVVCPWTVFFFLTRRRDINRRKSTTCSWRSSCCLPLYPQLHWLGELIALQLKKTRQTTVFAGTLNCNRPGWLSYLHVSGVGNKLIWFNILIIIISLFINY